MAHGKGRLIHSDADGKNTIFTRLNVLIWIVFGEFTQSMRVSGRTIKRTAKELTHMQMERSTSVSG
jgi:hypothetical protein